MAFTKVNRVESFRPIVSDEETDMINDMLNKTGSFSVTDLDPELRRKVLANLDRDVQRSR